MQSALTQLYVLPTGESTIQSALIELCVLPTGESTVQCALTQLYTTLWRMAPQPQHHLLSDTSHTASEDHPMSQQCLSHVAGMRPLAMPLLVALI